MVKKILLIIVLMAGLPVLAAEYKVVRVVDGDTIYLDFNKNGKADSHERVRLNGIDAFEVHPSNNLSRQMNCLNLSVKESLGLGYMGKQFAEKELLGKTVDANFTAGELFDKYNRPLMSITYDNGKNFEREILKSGLALVYRQSNLADKLKRYENIKKIKENAELTSSLKLIYYNKKEDKTYPIDSDEAFNPENILMEFPE